MYGAIYADKAQMRRRERSKSSGSSLQNGRGDRRRKEDTSKDKCQMGGKRLGKTRDVLSDADGENHDSGGGGIGTETDRE